MDFWRFSQSAVDAAALLDWSYDLRLVFLSFAVATAAAYATLEIIERVRAYLHGRLRLLWIGIGAATMGCGVWAMHFVGMLAYRLPVPMNYDLSLTAASALPPIAGSGFAVHLLGRVPMANGHLQLAGLSMGLGIGVMHYTGMEAMRLSALLRYDLPIFIAAVLVAFLLATAAFWADDALGRRLENERFLASLLGALILGAAVCGLHYTAMRAARFYPDPSSGPVSGMLFSPFALSSVILAVTSFIAAVAVGGAFLDRHLRRAQSDLERLRGMLHICSWCKRIPDDDAWYDLEAYISRREEASFSHGICPQCSATEFGTLPGGRTP